MAESGQTLGPYVLEAPLGGSSSTFRAQHRERQQWVCLKLLPAALRGDTARLQQRQRKVLATGYLQHPGVVRTLDFVDVEGQVCVVTEYIDGQPLAALLATGTPPLSQSLRILRAAGEALGAAHAANVAHGGLEPGKILVGSAGAHVAGIGGRDDDAALNPGDEAPGAEDLCTAPERYRGLPESPAADVWSLGAILYRCLKGTYPFAATSRRELAHLVHAGSFASPTYALIAFQAAVDRVLQTALSPDPAARYEDGTAFARAIAELESMALPELRHAPPAPSTALGVAAPSPAGFVMAAPPPEAAPPQPFDDPFASGIPPAAYSLGSYDGSAPVPAPPPLPPDEEAEAIEAIVPPSAAVTAPPSFGAIPMTPPEDGDDEDIAVEEVALPAAEAPLALAPSVPASPDDDAPAAPLPPALPAATAASQKSPSGGGRGLLWVGAAAAAAIFFVADPLGLRGEGGDGGVPPPPTTVVAETSSGAPGAGVATPVETPAVTTSPPTPEAADAGAVPVVETVAAVENGAGTAALEPEAGNPPPAEAPTTPEGTYAAARDALEETIAARNLLWTDDKTLDKHRLQSRKDAKKKEFEKATAAANKALAAAKAVKVNDKFVKRKLLRYLKRRRDLPKGEAKDQAIETENEARKLLKAGDVEEANRLLSDGLRKMYVEREAEGASEGSASSSAGKKASSEEAVSAPAAGEEAGPSEGAASESPAEAKDNPPAPVIESPPAEQAPAPAPAPAPAKAEETSGEAGEAAP